MPLSLNNATAETARDPRQKPALIIEKGGRVGQVELKEGVQVIGGDATSDIVVLGLEAKRYISLELDISNESTSAVVQILTQGVRIGSRTVEPGDILTIPNDNDIYIGDTRLSILGLSQPKDRAFAKRKLAAAMLIAGALGSAIFAFLEPINQPAPMATKYAVQANVPIAVTMKEMRDAFRMSGLKLDVRLDQDSAEMLIGDEQTELNITEKEKLASIISVFSKRSSVPLVDRTRLTSGLEGLIAAAALEPVKFVVGSDGKRYKEGDILSQKWKIDSIEPGIVKLSREGKQDVITIAPFSDPLVLRLADRSNEKALKR